MGLMDVQNLSPGQQKARKRWGTQKSGAAFDRKKTSYLTEEAQMFITQRAYCVIAGPGPESELCGQIALGESGFVQTPNGQTCLLPLDSTSRMSPILVGLQRLQREGRAAQLGLFFICHSTRQRLCVQGRAELLSGSSQISHSPAHKSTWVRLHVQKAFFHCAKYIRTNVTGLTAPVEAFFKRKWQPSSLRDCNQRHLSEEIRAFLAEQVLCFLCTMDREGQYAANHRGGAPGFLVTLPPSVTSPGEIILLPNYAGNGAFEAIGNILETGKATLIVPTYAAQLALRISGSAHVIEMKELPAETVQYCPGAERIVALTVQYVETQSGDWSATLAYERARAETMTKNSVMAMTCLV